MFNIHPKLEMTPTEINSPDEPTRDCSRLDFVIRKEY